MASVTSQALLLQGANAVAARPGWHWPLSVIPDIPIWRDHSLFSDNAWLAALPFTASIVPKSNTWQPPLSAPDYLKSRPLQPRVTDASSYAGNWLSSAGIIPAATPAYIGWQQELSVSRVTKQPLLAESVNGASWLEAATFVSPAVAFLARTSGLNATHINAYTVLINGLVSDGIWSKFDVLRIYATQDRTTALLNLISANYTGTDHGSPSFSVDLGFTGVDASSTVYIDSNFNPVTATSPNYVQNSAHISVWNLTNAASTASGGIVIGNDNTTSFQTNIIPKYSDGSAYFRVNGTNIAGVANTDAFGHYVANRSTSTALQGYKNGSSILTNGGSSSALVNANMIDLAENQNGTPSFGGGFQIASTSIGSSLSAGDVTLFYNRLHAYMNAVGVTVEVVPSELTGLIGWWDAKVSASLTLSGSNVLSWADQSGNGNTLTWLVNGKPTYSATGFNSLPAVSTIASPNFSSLQVSVFPMGTGNTLTFWWVGQFDFGTSSGAGGTALSYVYPGGTSDTNDVRSWRTGNHASAPNEQQITRNNTPSIFATCANDANHRVIGTIDSSGVQTLYVDGVATALHTVAGNWATGGVFSLGRSAAGATNFWGGAFGEAGVATGFTDAATVAGLDLYLKNKWGL